MSHIDRALTPREAQLAKARAKVLARQDREMKADLIKVRRESGLTQQDVADRLGVSQQAIQKLERYDSDPKVSTLRRYANAVGALIEHRVTPDEGQSVWLATARWDIPMELSTRRVQSSGTSTCSRSSVHWATSSHIKMKLAS